MRAQDLERTARVLGVKVFAVGLHPVACIDTDPVVEQKRVFDEVVIAMRIQICPDQRDQRADDQEQRVVGDEIPDAIHLRQSLPFQPG